MVLDGDFGNGVVEDFVVNPSKNQQVESKDLKIC